MNIHTELHNNGEVYEGNVAKKFYSAPCLEQHMHWHPIMQLSLGIGVGNTKPTSLDTILTIPELTIPDVFPSSD